MKINFKSTLFIMNLFMMMTIDFPVECGLISKRAYQDTLPEMDQLEALENKAESEANFSYEPNADEIETLETTSINESSEDHMHTQVDQTKSEETTLTNLIELSTAETTLSITESSKPIPESIEASLSTLTNLLDQSTAQDTTSETEYSTSQPLLLENTEKEDSIVQNNETAAFQPSLLSETEQSIENNPVITDKIAELVNTTEESILENTEIDKDSINEITPDQTKDISVHEPNVTQESVAETESSATQSILTKSTNETYKENTEPDNSSLVTENENLTEATTETSTEATTEAATESTAETTVELSKEMTIVKDQLETTTTELSSEDTSEVTTKETVPETTTQLLLIEASQKTEQLETSTMETETEPTTETPLATKYVWKKPDPYENDKIMNEETKLTANCPSLNCEFGYKTDLFGKVLCSCFNPCLENKCGPNRVCQIKKVADDKFLGLCFDPAKVERPVKCHLPLAPGKCKDPSLKNYSSRFYFDSFHQTCKHFVFTGCNGNANNFENWEKCQMECNTCSLPPVKGPCKASIIRYYFDQINQSCVPFSFGGCKGNENNFASKKQCEESCLIRKEAPPLTCLLRLYLDCDSCLNYFLFKINPKALYFCTDCQLKKSKNTIKNKQEEMSQSKLLFNLNQKYQF